LFVRAQPLHEPRIVQRGLAVGRAHLLQRVQAASDHLLAVRRHLLPFRQQRSLHVLALLGRHRLPRAIAVLDAVSLRGRKTVVSLKVLANLLLSLRGQAAEAFIVLKEVFLLLRRHLPQPLRPLARQPRSALSVHTTATIRSSVRSLALPAIGIRRRTKIIAVGMLSALIRAAGSSGTVWVIRVRALIAASIAALISIRPSARSLRMILGMRRLHALLPELRPRIHAPTAARPLRRSRLRAQQGREKQPHRERE
jgi:hypothetical protein